MATFVIMRGDAVLYQPDVPKFGKSNLIRIYASSLQLRSRPMRTGSEIIGVLRGIGPRFKCGLHFWPQQIPDQNDEQNLSIFRNMSFRCETKYDQKNDYHLPAPVAKCHERPARKKEERCR